MGTDAAVSGGYFRRRVGAPLLALFTQGAAPRSIAECVVLGMLVGLFPVYGTNTILLTVIAVRRKLNLPAIQAVNWLAAGPQLALWIPFMRIGERLLGDAPLPLAADQIGHLVREDFGEFLRGFGMSVVHAVAGWAAAGVPVAWIAYAALAALLRRRAERPGQC